MPLPYLETVRGPHVYIDGVPIDGAGRVGILNFEDADGSYDPIAKMATIGPTRERTIKTPVRAVTTANLAATRSGNVLTATSNGALASQDGVSLVVGNRLLVWNQSTAANNGLYEVTSLGSAGTPYVLTRTSDANLSAHFFECMLVPVQEGTLYGNKRFQLTAADPITLNSTALTFGIDVSALQLLNTQIITISGSWTKQSGTVLVLVDLIGGGGGGGGGADGSKGAVRQGGTGGGGGARIRQLFRAEDLNSSESCFAGAGGKAGAAGSGGAGGNGGAGGESFFGVSGSFTRLAAFGGGGGNGGSSGTARSGGAGGGCMSVGTAGGTGNVAGGEPGGAVGGNSGFGGGGATAGAAGSCAFWGGAGGGGVPADGSAPFKGGISYFAGGGGGGGGGITAANTASDGGDGGMSGPTVGGFLSGFGVSGGVAAPGGAGIAGMNGAGTGGGGGAGSGTHAGGAGGLAGGGGGGGGSGTGGAGIGGVGGAGIVRIYSYG